MLAALHGTSIERASSSPRRRATSLRRYSISASSRLSFETAISAGTSRPA